jgi:hypothetical protein
MCVIFSFHFLIFLIFQSIMSQKQKKCLKCSGIQLCGEYKQFWNVKNDQWMASSRLSSKGTRTKIFFYKKASESTKSSSKHCLCSFEEKMVSLYDDDETVEIVVFAKLHSIIFQKTQIHIIYSNGIFVIDSEKMEDMNDFYIRFEDHIFIKDVDEGLLIIESGNHLWLMNTHSFVYKPYALPEGMHINHVRPLGLKGCFGISRDDDDKGVWCASVPTIEAATFTQLCLEKDGGCYDIPKDVAGIIMEKSGYYFPGYVNKRRKNFKDANYLL